MKWLDNWLRKRISEVLDKWFIEQKSDIQVLNNDISSLTTEIGDLRQMVEEIQQITMKTQFPIEEYIFDSRRFQASLDHVKSRAKQRWLTSENLQPRTSNLNGTVTQDEPFECIISERFMIVMAGLKTKYLPDTPEDQARYRMQISDRRSPPFLVNSETKHVIFLRHYFLDEEYMFSIRQIEGSGTLKFSLIGATLSRYNDLFIPEFRLRPTKRCFICGRTIDSEKAIADAKLLEKYTGQTSGILCCSCFKVAKVIIDGKTQGGE